MARPKRHDGVVFRRKGSKLWWMRYCDRTGQRHRESTLTENWQEAQKRLRERLLARDDNVLEVVRKGEGLTLGQWVEHFLTIYSTPPVRAEKTHAVNVRVAKILNVTLGSRKLGEITADEIEVFLRVRLRQRRRFKTSKGYRETGVVKPSTVHQEFRVLRRILNVAVRKRLLPSNPCCGVEFPVTVKGMFRPHYVPWSEQQRIESHAPAYLCNAIRIVTETGMRIYKELICMKRDQLDLANAVVWISDSKTPSGEAEVPLTELALDAFKRQLAISGRGQYLFPSDANDRGHQKSFKTAWRATLRRAKVPYFRIYDLRSTYATRLSAGGVADEWVTQLLRQGDAQVFKKYSQMKLQMKREALGHLNRKANEMQGSIGTLVAN